MKKNTKPQYRLRNWSQYNAALKQRGSLTLWFDEDLARRWSHESLSGKRGASRYYTDVAISTVSTLGSIYGLAGRQTSGLLESLVELMGLDLPIPDHSTVSRRLSKLEVSLPVTAQTSARHVVVDSTGVKVFGEGEWKTRQHGISKRRTWRKLHLAVDDRSGELLASVVSTNDLKDNQVLEELLEQIDGPISQVSADGAYDSRDSYESIVRRGAKAAIPPRKDAKIWRHGNTQGRSHPRDENLRQIRLRGRAKWKRECGYHRRSLSETAMYRMKTIFGGRVRARQFDRQAAQLLLQCAALNRMTQLGMPETEIVER